MRAVILEERVAMAVDRRVQRTRHLLSKALMELIPEKGYDAITVQEITDRANLGRATFYLHYRDKEDLLYNSLEETFDELTSLITSSGAPQLLSERETPLFEPVFRHAAEHADLYRIIFSGQGTATITLRIREYTAGTIKKHILKFGPAPEGEIPLEVISNYMAGGICTMIEWWLQNDMPYSPEKMSEMFRQLMRAGVRLVRGAE